MNVVTVNEKRAFVTKYCQDTECDECPLNKQWCHVNDIQECDEASLDEAILLINPHKDDPVNHPSHYTQGGIECIDAMISAFGKDYVAEYCIINAFKYLYRYKHKNGVEDIKKANWYLNKYIELVEG